MGFFVYLTEKIKMYIYLKFLYPDGMVRELFNKLSEKESELGTKHSFCLFVPHSLENVYYASDLKYPIEEELFRLLHKQSKEVSLDKQQFIKETTAEGRIYNKNFFSTCRG